MKPLNQVERTRAFLRFLLLFLITALLIVAVVMFSVEVPLRENEQLRKKLATQQIENAVSHSFDERMKEAVEEMRNFGANIEPPRATYESVKGKIDEMGFLLRDIPPGRKDINKLIITNLEELNKAKYEKATRVP